MKRTLYIIVVVALLGTPAHAATEQEFAAASEAASKKYDGPGGRDYAIKFIGGIGKCTVDAMHACNDTNFKDGLYYDIVFIVSSEGRLERTVATVTNEYAKCIASHMKLPDSVAKPPGTSWPVQIRVLHGPRKTEGPDLPFMIFSDTPSAQR
jgi:hypothetical protein